MADEKEADKEAPVEEAPEQAEADEERTPNPGPGPAYPPPLHPEPTEEELEKAAEEKKEAEDAAREAAENQPEDPSVEAKTRQPILVLKEQFDAEWPLQAERFPGVEPEFGKEKDGYVELKNVQAPAMAFATNCAAPVLVTGKPERSQHGWDDYVDNSLPPQDDAEEGDIEAKPKTRRRQTKVSTRA